ncbi:hypothetical protein BGW39_002504 [Mortierella sp. 14UC]|nr:hypothetical protein BGW39_002504 [Mortierella sp. 14UC]
MTQLSIFDIPLIVGTICEDLSPGNTYNCRKTSKDFHKAFLRPHWRDISIGVALIKRDLKAIEKHASWIRTLNIDYSKDEVWSTYYIDDTILPVLPALTRLTRIDMRLEMYVDPELVIGILNPLPDSVRILELDYQNNRVEEPNRTWKPNELEQICFRGEDKAENEELYLVPVIKASPELRALRIPSFSSDHPGAFMEALGQSCPNLRYLVLNKNKVGFSWGNEALYFQHIQQPLKMLRIDLAQDRYSNIVISTLLKYSAGSIQELRLHNMDGFPDEPVDQLVNQCPNLRCVYYRDNYSYQRPNMIEGKACVLGDKGLLVSGLHIDLVRHFLLSTTEDVSVPWKGFLLSSTATIVVFLPSRQDPMVRPVLSFEVLK